MEKIEKKRNFYDADEFMAVLDGLISRPFVYKQIAAGVIPTINIGRRKLIPAWYVEQLLSPPIDKNDDKPGTRGRL